MSNIRKLFGEVDVRYNVLFGTEELCRILVKESQVTDERLAQGDTSLFTNTLLVVIVIIVVTYRVPLTFSGAVQK